MVTTMMSVAVVMVTTVVRPSIIVTVSIGIIIIAIAHIPYTARQNEKKQNHCTCQCDLLVHGISSFPSPLVKNGFQGKKSQWKVIISTGVKQRPESEAAPFWFSPQNQDRIV
jgi:hypothetical protein